MDYAENKKVEASTISGDNKIEVSGIMPKDATANVAKLEKANAVEIAKKYKENIKEENVINAFDISVKSEDIKYQPAEHNQEVKVKISNFIGAAQARHRWAPCLRQGTKNDGICCVRAVLRPDLPECPCGCLPWSFQHCRSDHGKFFADDHRGHYVFFHQ